MKQEERGDNAILTELILAVLFFMLCACVLVRVFVGAAAVSRSARRDTRALALGQNIADEIYTADDPDAALTRLGFEKDGGKWEMRTEEFRVSVTGTEESTAYGGMRRAEVTVADEKETLLTLPCVRFIPGEAAP